MHFDIWAHHPYTSGGPNHKATLPNDVSLGDLPKMRKMLVEGIKAGHVVSTHEVAFWVTEFSYESNPPDPGGLKPGLGARWTSEALYRMWRAGVTQVTWFLLTDQPYTSYFAQSGIYLRGSPSPQGDKPKSDPPVLHVPLRGVPDRQPEGRQQSLARRIRGTGSGRSSGDAFRPDSGSA